jgi:phage tail sheath protein FI
MEDSKIATLPPSITPVETAIPVFIGYTAKADETVAGDLHLKPTRISSLIEYEQHFGLAQSEESVTVTVTMTAVGGVTTPQKAVASVQESAGSRHIVRYALQMFFANGGGPCWIVSVGSYKATLGEPLVEAELHAGLDASGKEDEPTLIVIPEAQNLSLADYKTLMDAALAQCAELQDRFVIMDLHGGAISMSDPGANLPAAIATFRSSGIGTTNLTYGAAYAPDIQTALDLAVDEATTRVTITTNGIAALPVTLSSLKSSNNAVYGLATAAIKDMPCTLPPSSAVAGIYASVDRARGVWKAPANVSLVNVSAPAIRSRAPIRIR